MTPTLDQAALRRRTDRTLPEAVEKPVRGEASILSIFKANTPRVFLKFKTPAFD
jgi:hypothetical protein